MVARCTANGTTNPSGTGSPARTIAPSAAALVPQVPADASTIGTSTRNPFNTMLTTLC